MSWVSKTLKKATNSIKKTVKNPIRLADPFKVYDKYVLSPMQTMTEITGKMGDEYKRNEGLYNRALATIAAAVVTGGVGAVAAGGSFGAGAAAGAVGGAIGASAEGGKEAYMNSAANAKQRAQEEAQRRINAINAAASPTNQSQYNYEGVTPGMRSALYANYKTKQKGGTSKSTLGGSNNTMLG